MYLKLVIDARNAVTMEYYLAYLKKQPRALTEVFSDYCTKNANLSVAVKQLLNDVPGQINRITLNDSFDVRVSHRLCNSHCCQIFVGSHLTCMPLVYPCELVPNMRCSQQSTSRYCT
jgi:hypothetical protein